VELSTITAGPDGALWFTDPVGNQIGRIATTGNGCSLSSPCITEYPVPLANSHPETITAGPDGALWFTGGYTGEGGNIMQAIPAARRNGVDLSASAGLPSASILVEFQQAGVQYIVVNTPQSGKWVKLAGKQLQAFSGAGFKTAAYCALSFGQTAASGTQQAQNCLDTIGSATISFVALDVENSDATACAPPAPSCITIISDALAKITNPPPNGAGKNAVIYTASDYWSATTGGTNQFSSYKLWTAATARFEGYVDPAGNLACSTSLFGPASLMPQRHCGNGIPSLTPFRKFGGWSAQAGNQYDIGATAHKCDPGACLFGVQVDFDVFDSSLFP
jgi:hypothetical protein